MGENTHQNCTRQNKNKEDPGRQQPCWGFLFCTNLTQPTGALDSENSHALMAMIQELHREGKTIVLITHEREIAEYADRIVLIRDGILYEEGENADDTDDTNHKRNSQAMQEA